MSSRSNIGGVFSVELWLAEDNGRSDPPTSLDSTNGSVRVPLISSQSQYSESVVISGGVSKVEHTLTLVTEAADDFWSDSALDQAQRVGCIGEVVLSSKGTILLGWSSRLGYDQPLRLVKVTSQSGASVNEGYTKSWTFKSYSTESLI